jgi:hypothetical protein
MLNILETDFVSAEQPCATQTRLETTAATAFAEAPSASAKPPPLAQLKSRSKEEIDWVCDLDTAMTRAQAIAHPIHPCKTNPKNTTPRCRTQA